MRKYIYNYCGYLFGLSLLLNIVSPLAAMMGCIISYNLAKKYNSLTKTSKLLEYEKSLDDLEKEVSYLKHSLEINITDWQSQPQRRNYSNSLPNRWNSN
jgi:hypothetical protein